MSLATFSTGSLADPPGLRKENKVPPGLAKNGTPPGWQNVQAAHGEEESSILETLARTDGSQALVAAVEVGEGSCPGVRELLASRPNKVVLLAPTNEGFERLLALDPGALVGLEIDAIASVLPVLLQKVGLDTDALCDVLLKHVSVSRGGPPSSESLLLRRGSITVEDGSNFVVGIGENGVCINRESCITKPNVFTQNDVIHFVNSVIQDVPPEEPPEGPPDEDPNAIEAWCDRNLCETNDALFNQCIDFMGICLAEANTDADREQCAGAGLLICIEPID
jgi:uncharacterized surface protein with fasciclin (FAS1) repeats